MPNDVVIQGLADLNLTPFLTKLAQLEAAVNTTASNVGLTMQRMAASTTAGVQGMSGAVNAMAFAANRAASSMANTTQGMGAAVNTMSSTATQAAAKLSSTTNQIAQSMSRATQGMVGNLNQAGTAAQRAGGQMGATQQSILLLGDVMGEQAQHIKKVEDALNSLYRAGAQISQVSMTVGMMGAAILGLEGVAINSAKSFDFWTNKFIAAGKAAGGFVQDATLMKQVPDILEQVGIATGAAFDQVAEGAYYFESAAGAQINTTRDLQGVMIGLTKILEAVAITGDDVGTWVRSVIQILGGFHMSLDQVGHVVETVVNATQISNAEWTDLTEAIKMSSAAAYSAGVPMEDLVAVLADLSNVGIQGTQAGRGLQRFLMGLIDPGKEAAGALQAVVARGDELGRSWKDIISPGGQFIGLLDKTSESGEKQLGVIGLMYQKTLQMTEADRQEFLAKITTENAYRVIMPLMIRYGEEQASVARAQADGNTELANSIPTMERMAAQLKDTQKSSKLFSDQWEQIRSSIQVSWAIELNRLKTILIEFGDAASNVLLPMVSKLGDMAQGMKQWAQDNEATFHTLVTIITVIGLVSVALGAFGFVFGQVMQGMVAVGTLLDKAGLAIMVVFGHSLEGLITRMGLLGAAVIVLGEAWRQNWGGMADVMNNVVAAAKDVLGALVLTIVGVFQILVALFQGDWQKAWDQAGQIILMFRALVELHLRGLIDSLGTLLGNMGQALSNKLREMGLGMLVDGANLIAQLAAGMMGAAAGLLTPVLTSIANLIGSFFKGQSPPKEGPLKEIKEWGENVIGAYGEGVKKGAQSKIKPAAKEAAQAMAGPMEGHSPPKEGPLKDIKEWSENIAGAYAEGLEEAADKTVGPAADKIAETLASKVADATEGVKAEAPKAQAAAENFIDALMRGFKKADFSALNDAMSTVTTYLQNAMQDKKITPQGFLSGVTEIRSILVDMMSKVTNGGEMAAGAFDKVKAIVGDIASDIQAVVTAYGQLAVEQGKLDDMKANQKNLKTQQEEQVTKPIQALTDQSADLDIAKQFWDTQKQGVQELISKEEARKAPLEATRALIAGAIEGYQDQIRAIGEANHRLEDQKRVLEEQKYPIQDTIDAIQERISALNDEKNPIQDAIDGIQERVQGEQDAARVIQDRISDLNDEKGELQDQVKAVEERYKQEQEAAKQVLSDMRDQLDLVKETNAEKLKPLQATADTAGDTLEAKKKKDAAEEEVIQRRIQDYRSRGVGTYYLDKLQTQLDKLKNQHEDEQGLLSDQKDAAQDALDKAKEKISTEEDALSKDLSTRERAENQIQKQREAATAAETASQTARLAAIDLETKTLDKKAKVIDRQIEADQLAAKVEEAKLKNIDKQIEAEQRASKVEENKLKNIDKQIAPLDKQERANNVVSDEAQHKVTNLESQDRGWKKQEDVIDRQIAVLKGQSDNYQNELDGIAKRQTVINNEKALLEQKGRPIAQALVDIGKQIDDQQTIVDKYQAQYDLAKAIADEHERTRKAIEDAAKAQEALDKAAASAAGKYSPDFLDESNPAFTKPLAFDWSKWEEDALASLSHWFDLLSSGTQTQMAKIVGRDFSQSEHKYNDNPNAPAESKGPDVGGMISNIPDWAKHVAALGTAMAAVNSVGAELFVLFTGMGGALAALGAAIAPVLVVFAALGLILTPLETNFLGIRDAWGNLIASLDTNLLDSVGKAFDLIGSALGGLVKAFSGVDGPAVTFGDVLNVIVGALNVVGSVLHVVAMLVTTVLGGAFTFVVGMISTAIATIVDVITVFVNIVKALFTGDWQAVFESMSKLWTDFASGIGNAFGGLGQTIGDGLGAIGPVIEQAMGGALTALKDWFTNLPGNLGEAVGSFGGWLGNEIGSKWTAIQVWVGSTLNDLRTWFTELPGNLGEAIGGVAGKLGETIGTTWTCFTTWLSSTFTAITTWFTDLPGNLAYSIGFVAGWLSVKIPETWTCFTTWLSSTFTAIVTWLTELPGKLGEQIGKTAAALGTAISTTWDCFTKWLGNTFTAITTWLTELPGKLGEQIGKTAAALGTSIGTTWDCFTKWLSSTFTAIVTWLSELPGKLGEQIGKTAAALGTAIGTTWDCFTTWLSSTFTAIGTWLTELPGKLLEKLTSTGQAMGTSILNGIKGVLNGVGDFFGNIGTQIGKGFAAGQNSASGGGATVQPESDTQTATINGQTVSFSNNAAGDAKMREAIWKNEGSPDYNKMNLLKAATGGLVMKPSLAMVAEDEPEVIIPLSKLLKSDNSLPVMLGQFQQLIDQRFALWADQLSRMSAPTQAISNVHLHVGVLVADDRGLTELERRLKTVRDVRSSRIAG
jgi:hypothetical protein